METGASALQGTANLLKNHNQRTLELGCLFYNNSVEASTPRPDGLLMLQIN